MAAPGVISDSCVVDVLHVYVLGLPGTFGQKRHSFEPPGAHKWHLGIRYVDKLRRELLVRDPLFQEIRW